jgi:plastocyanin
MRVPPPHGERGERLARLLREAPVVWLLRGVLLLGVVSFGWLALASPRSERSDSAPTALPLPTLAPQPTQTPRPITSIIVRDTLAPYPTAAPPPANQVSVVDFSYMPGVVRITTGQTVTWRNEGTEQHDVTGSDWHSGPLDPGYTYHLTFGIAGTYAYRCSIHLDMTGTIVVT